MVQVVARMLLLAGCYTLLIASQTFAWDNICESGGKNLSLTAVNFRKYYNDEIRNRLFDGKGRVRDVRLFGVNRNYVVKVDCGNGIVVNVATSTSQEDLKVGQEVSFDGRCFHYKRRGGAKTSRGTITFEFEGGSVK